MKIKIFHYFLLASILMLLLAPVTISARSLFKNKVEWINLSTGASYPVYSRWGNGNNFSLNYQFGEQIFYQAGLDMTQGLTGGTNYIVNTFHFSAGICDTSRHFLAAAFIGPSLNFGKAKIPDVSGLITLWGQTNSIGLVLNGQLFFRIPSAKEFGFGTEIYANFNRAINYYGVRFSLLFGNGN